MNTESEVKSLLREAVELKPGGIYVLQVKQHVTNEELRNIQDIAVLVGARLGVDFVVLTQGIELVTKQV